MIEPMFRWLARVGGPMALVLLGVKWRAGELTTGSFVVLGIMVLINIGIYLLYLGAFQGYHEQEAVRAQAWLEEQERRGIPPSRRTRL